MKWPAIVRFDRGDELEIIESQSSWDAFLETADADCQLILSDGAVRNITIDTNRFPSVTTSDEAVSVDTAVELAQKHMAALAHCCVSKFSAPSVEAVIAALIQLDD